MLRARYAQVFTRMSSGYTDCAVQLSKAVALKHAGQLCNASSWAYVDADGNGQLVYITDMMDAVVHTEGNVLQLAAAKICRFDTAELNIKVDSTTIRFSLPTLQGLLYDCAGEDGNFVEFYVPAFGSRVHGFWPCMVVSLDDLVVNVTTFRCVYLVNGTAKRPCEGDEAVFFYR